MNKEYRHKRYASLTSEQAEIQACIEIDRAKEAEEYWAERRSAAQKELDEIHASGGHVRVTNHGIEVILRGGNNE